MENHEDHLFKAAEKEVEILERLNKADKQNKRPENMTCLFFLEGQRGFQWLFFVFCRGTHDSDDWMLHPNVRQESGTALMHRFMHADEAVD